MEFDCLGLGHQVGELVGWELVGWEGVWLRLMSVFEIPISFAFFSGFIFRTSRLYEVIFFMVANTC